MNVFTSEYVVNFFVLSFLQEEKDKKLDNEAAFRSWKESKADLLKKQAREKKAAEKKKEEEEKQKIEKKLEADKVLYSLSHWNSSLASMYFHGSHYQSHRSSRSGKKSKMRSLAGKNGKRRKNRLKKLLMSRMQKH